MQIEEEDKLISKIILFLKESSVFAEKKPNINIDYLGKNIEDYSLEAVPAERIIRRFITGEKEKQKIFIFASRKTFSQDEIENFEDYQLFEELAEWIEEQNDNEKYPDISDIEKIEEIESMEVIDSPYVAAVSETEARYQMEIKINYIQK